MALSIPFVRRIVPAHPGLYGAEVMTAPEGANQTFKKGTPLIRSSGLLVAASADPVANLVGIAEEDGHNAASGAHRVAYVPALRHIVFKAVLEDESNNNHALVITNMWTDYALQVDTATGAWFVDENDTSNTAVIIVDFEDALATVKATVYFRFLDDVTVYNT